MLRLSVKEQDLPVEETNREHVFNVWVPLDRPASIWATHDTRSFESLVFVVLLYEYLCISRADSKLSIFVPIEAEYRSRCVTHRELCHNLVPRKVNHFHLASRVAHCKSILDCIYSLAFAWLHLAPCKTLNDNFTALLIPVFKQLDHLKLLKIPLTDTPIETAADHRVWLLGMDKHFLNLMSVAHFSRVKTFLHLDVEQSDLSVLQTQQEDFI